MSRLDPDIVVAVFIVLTAIVGMVCMVLNTISAQKRKPSMDIDVAELKASQCLLKAELKAKQSTRVCNEIVDRLDRHHAEVRKQLSEITARHTESERDASSKLAAVHERINTVLSAISTLGGKFEEHNRRET